MEKGNNIFIQSNSDEQLKTALNKFESKMNVFNNYDYYIITEIKPKFTSTIEENGLCGKNAFVLAKEKRQLDSDDTALPNMDEQKCNNLNVVEKNDVFFDGFNLGLSENINVIFKVSTGLNFTFVLNSNNTFEYALKKFCSITGIDSSSIGKDIIFIYDAQQLKADDKRTIGQFNNNLITITVIDIKNMIGA